MKGPDTEFPAEGPSGDGGRGQPSMGYRPLPSAAPEAELSALLSIYTLAIRKAEEKEKAGATNAGENAEKRINDGSRRKTILSQAG